VRPRQIAAGCILALLAGCGGGDDDSDESPERPLAADLTVVVRKNPDDVGRRRTIRCTELGPKAPEPACRRLAGLSSDQLAPVPADTACTQIYGGPSVASVKGTLRGERVDASFELINGCEIERWDRNRVLLGDLPGG
jgi:hypothetical protein